MSQDAELQPAVAAEFLALADLLGQIPTEGWDTPSLCEGWRVRELIAHLTMPARYDQASFMKELQARQFDFAKLSNDIAARDGQTPPADLVANLRSERLHHWTPPDGGSRGALNHVVIHGLDATVPLGAKRRPPDKTMRIVLDDLTEGGVHEHFGTEVADRRLEATDLPWSWGSGPVLRGNASYLALVLCGRKVPEEHLEGAPL
jgi:uncharacterized protein (TIGR03083 family)